MMFKPRGVLGRLADDKGARSAIDFLGPRQTPVKADVDVARRGSTGFGATPGVRYLSSGFKVQTRDAAELDDLLRLWYSGSFDSVGTSRMFTS